MKKLGGYRIGKPREDVKQKQKTNTDKLPPIVDLRKYLTSVEEQVGNSCVANAFAGAYEYLAKRHLGDAADVSRLFIYYNARAEIGEEDQDGGSEMYSAIEALKKYGACAEELWHNAEDMITEAPPDEAYEHASQFTVSEAEAIETDLDLWRSTLAEGYPIAFALNTFDSFDEANDNKGKVPMPRKTDNVRSEHGWHAMLCVGYSDKDQMFIVRNSWSEEWGDKGYCYIPYKYVMHEDYNGHDSWIIKAVSDLEFDRDVWIEEDGSYLTEDGALVLYDFEVAVEDADAFADDLEALCLEYCESEEDFYFDYEFDEAESYVIINSFEISTESPDEFLEDLENLCIDYAGEDGYDFKIEGEEDEEEEEEE